MTRSGILLGLSLLLAFASVTRADDLLNRPTDRTYDLVVDSGYLKVGVYQNFPPFSFKQDGKPAGVDVDIGRAIAKAMGVEFRVHWIVPDESLSDDLRNNVWKGHYLDKTRVADVMMRVPYDKEYAYMRDSTGEMVNGEVVLFGPYQQEHWAIAYDGNKIDSVPTMAIFQYHPIGVELDTLPAIYLSSGLRGRLRDHVHHFHTVGQAFDALSSGEIEAVMAMRSEVDYQVSRRPDSPLKLAATGFPGIGKQQWDVGMAVKSSHRQLGYKIEAIVDGLVRSGEMKTIFDRYGLRYSMPGFYDEILGASRD